MKSYKEIYLIVITFINLNCGILKKSIKEYEEKCKNKNINLILKNIEEIDIDQFLYYFIKKGLLDNINIIDFKKLNDLNINNIDKFNFEDLYKIIFNNKNKLKKDHFIDLLCDYYNIFKIYNNYNSQLIIMIENGLQKEENLKKLENFLLKKGKENFELDKDLKDLYYDKISILNILKVIDKNAYNDFIKEKIDYINNREIRSNSQTF